MFVKTYPSKRPEQILVISAEAGCVAWLIQGWFVVAGPLYTFHVDVHCKLAGNASNPKWLTWIFVWYYLIYLAILMILSLMSQSFWVPHRHRKDLFLASPMVQSHGIHMAFTWQTPRFFHRFVIIPSHLYHKSTILYRIYFHFGPQDTKRTHMCIHTFKTNTHTHEYIYID